MLILADGQDVRDLVPDDERIRLLHLDGTMQIGAKRNFGCEQANGTVIAHWDDDDYSSPNRLADQIQRLDETGKSVTGYRTMRFTNGVKSWLYLGAPLFVVGTSLCYRREWWAQHPFPGIQIAEDSAFATIAAAARQLAVSDAGDLMYATIHETNTSPRQTEGSSWKPL